MGETPVTPSLPTIIYRPDAVDRDVCAAISGWCQQHGRTEVRDVLAAVLAARHTNAIDVGAYVAKCLQDGIRDHWLRRADVLLTASPRAAKPEDLTSAIRHLRSMSPADLDAFASRVLTGGPLQIFEEARSEKRDPLKLDVVARQLARKLAKQEVSR